MARRLTMRVATLRDMTNTYLRNTDENALKGSQGYSAHDWQMMRLGVAQLLESVLHSTGNYKGFGYVTPHTVDETSRNYY